MADQRQLWHVVKLWEPWTQKWVKWEEGCLNDTVIPMCHIAEASENRLLEVYGEFNVGYSTEMGEDRGIEWWTQAMTQDLSMGLCVVMKARPDVAPNAHAIWSCVNKVTPPPE